MNEETLEALTAMAIKLGTTVEYLWGALVRQAPISAVAEALIGFALLGLSGFVARLAIKLHKAKGPDPWGDLRWEVFALGLTAAFASLITLGWWADHLEAIMAGFLNPEYWALKQLLLRN